MEQYYNYLNDLRDSGVTNMFGASPYLQEEFGLSRYELNVGAILFLVWAFLIKDKAMITVNAGLLSCYVLGLIVRG